MCERQRGIGSYDAYLTMVSGLSFPAYVYTTVIYMDSESLYTNLWRYIVHVIK